MVVPGAALVRLLGDVAFSGPHGAALALVEETLCSDGRHWGRGRSEPKAAAAALAAREAASAAEEEAARAAAEAATAKEGAQLFGGAAAADDHLSPAEAYARMHGAV